MRPSSIDNLLEFICANITDFFICVICSGVYCLIARKLINFRCVHFSASLNTFLAIHTKERPQLNVYVIQIFYCFCTTQIPYLAFSVHETIYVSQYPFKERISLFRHSKIHTQRFRLILKRKCSLYAHHESSSCDSLDNAYCFFGI